MTPTRADRPLGELKVRTPFSLGKEWVNDQSLEVLRA